MRDNTAVERSTIRHLRANLSDFPYRGKNPLPEQGVRVYGVLVELPTGAVPAPLSTLPTHRESNSDKAVGRVESVASIHVTKMIGGLRLLKKISRISKKMPVVISYG
jgi:hypothetical protein